MRLIKTASGKTQLKLTKAEWQKIGQRWTKTAMPVVPPSPLTKSKMEEEGIRLLLDINRMLPSTKIRELKGLLKDVGGVEGIFLPKVFYPTNRNVVTLNGKEYYYLHHEKSKAKSNPGKLWLLDLQSGDPVELPYEGTVEQLNLTDSARREEVRGTANSAIQQWNAKIDKLDGNVGLITIPLRVQRVAKLIDERLAILNSQVQATESQPEYASEGSEQWRQESLESLKSGTLNDQDAIDTALFWYQENPQQLLTDVETFNISDILKQTLRNIAQAEIGNTTDKNEKRQQDWQNREDRMGEELPEIREPTIQPVPEHEPGTLPGGSVQKPDAYRSFQSYQKQQSPKLKEINFQIKALQGVQAALNNVNAQIAGMQKGQFSDEYLGSIEGREVLQNMKAFLDAAYGFIKKYSVDVFTDEGYVNPKLFGRTGSMGNVELAVELNRLYNAVRKATQSRTSMATMPETTSVDMTPNVSPNVSPEISASAKLKLVKKANGKTVLRITKNEWLKIAQQQGWSMLTRKKEQS